MGGCFDRFDGDRFRGFGCGFGGFDGFDGGCGRGRFDGFRGRCGRFFGRGRDCD